MSQLRWGDAVPSDTAAARERLVDAAETCIDRFGLAKTTVEDVAREAAVSRATIYRYFANRDELVLAVLLRDLERSQRARARRVLRRGRRRGGVRAGPGRRGRLPAVGHSQQPQAAAAVAARWPGLHLHDHRRFRSAVRSVDRRRRAVPRRSRRRTGCCAPISMPRKQPSGCCASSCRCSRSRRRATTRPTTSGD